MSTAVEEPLVGRSADEAVPELVDRFGGKLFSFSLKFCGNREDAEDLVQETFLQAFRKWDQFEGRSAPSSWLYTIAARSCQRMRRKHAGEPSRIDSLDAAPPSGVAPIVKLPSDEDGPLDEGLRTEAVAIVDQALARLPVKFRLPLILKEIGELSVAEIASIVGVKEATVKTRLHRGRLALRAELTRHGDRPKSPSEDLSNQVCLDLLRAKMDAMDQGVEFPVNKEDLCERCKEFVESLDLASEACRWVAGGELPEELRKRLNRELTL